MKITQISIFLENRKGRLYEVCNLLAKHGINLLALTIAETEGFGVLRIIADRPSDAISLLKENSFAAKLTDVVVAEIEDSPGGLAKILKVLDDADLNIEYMHAFLARKSPAAYMVFRFDEPDRAIAVLRDAGVNVIGNNRINGL